MGRPREFDEGEVLEKALDCFWQRGFAACSIEHLTEATGLSRASLYGAFGDKETLFRRLLVNYRGRYAVLSDALHSEPDARLGLQRFFETWLLGSPRGCFLLQSQTSYAAGDPMTCQLFEETLRGLEAMFTRAVERGQATGVLNQRIDAEVLSTYLLTLQRGLATLVRGGRTPEELLPMMKEALRMLDPEVEAERSSAAGG